MAYRNGNYSAFYVAEPFSETNLGAHAQNDFVSYNLLRAWKGKEPSFPFIDSHDKTYNVRDGSDWEKTLKPRLRERLNKSKNIILFLSSNTKNSKALREEMEWGIESCELPIIVVYPEFKEKSDIVDYSAGELKKEIKALWDKLPSFRDAMGKVPTLHVPNKKDLIESALKNTDFMVGTKCNSGVYFYKR
jgi:hypothetical protein